MLIYVIIAYNKLKLYNIINIISVNIYIIIKLFIDNS